MVSGELMREAVNVLVALVQIAGVVIIFIGAGSAAVRLLVQGVRRRDTIVITPIRLSFGRFLSLGLEFQLAGDMLATAVAPSFADIGKLAAIAAIRTALNFFLDREAKQEQEQVRAERRERGEPSPGGGAA